MARRSFILSGLASEVTEYLRPRVGYAPPDAVLPTTPILDRGWGPGATSETEFRGREGADHDCPRTARSRAATRAGSLRPGADSTPLATSTIQGRRRASRPATFSGVRPPARI